MANAIEYIQAKSLPNKLLNPNGTITTINGEQVVNAVDAYKFAKSIPNKFLNPDGSTSTLEELGIGKDADIFIVVDELPATGEENKIYLVPNPTGDGTFLEYHYHDGVWDPVGTLDIDLSDYPTNEDMEQAINVAIYGALGGDY